MISSSIFVHNSIVLKKEGYIPESIKIPIGKKVVSLRKNF